MCAHFSVHSDSEEEEDNEDEYAQALDIPALDNNESLEFTRRFSSASLPSPTLDTSNHKNAAGVNSHSLIINSGARRAKVVNEDDADSDSTCSEESVEHISYHEFESEGKALVG